MWDAFVLYLTWLGAWFFASQVVVLVWAIRCWLNERAGRVTNRRGAD